MQTGQLPGAFSSIIDFKFFSHFNICPPRIKSSSIFTISNTVLSSISQFRLYLDCIEHLFDCQCGSFTLWSGILNYKLSCSQNVAMNTLFSSMDIFKFGINHANEHNISLYIPIWLYTNRCPECGYKMLLAFTFHPFVKYWIHFFFQKFLF